MSRFRLHTDRSPAQTTPTAEYIAMPDQEMRLVLKDPLTGGELTLGILVSLRDLEVLGSAGRYYAEAYDNPERPPEQVQSRRERAHRVGEALWEAAVELCDIESPHAS
jgi:hypothetical protein